MKTITVQPALTDEETRALAGKLLDEDSYDLLVNDEDTMVLKEDGSPLLVYLKGVLPSGICKQAYDNLRNAAIATDNRGMAAGDDFTEKTINSVRPHSGFERKGDSTRYKLIKKDGTVSNQTRAKIVNSGIVGYFEGNPRFPYCRLTAYNINHPTRFANAMPLIRKVNDVFKDNLPERYAAQEAVINQTSEDFYISETVFSTITVNLNWQTAVHTDKGDYAPGFGVLTALRAGKYTGGYFVLPKYRIGCDMQTGDVMLADVHEWHGNTPIVPQGRFERISLVFYYREKIQHCDTAEEELEKAKLNRGQTHVDW